mmetsp:Transcript_32127/g.76384  ORF Transcript_32127/g.76384 Transcript_32127/m.76384 type:complete len:301 (-) Transcript_32127:668-1570(-)
MPAGKKTSPPGKPIHRAGAAMEGAGRRTYLDPDANVLHGLLDALLGHVLGDVPNEEPVLHRRENDPDRLAGEPRDLLLVQLLDGLLRLLFGAVDRKAIAFVLLRTVPGVLHEAERVQLAGAGAELCHRLLVRGPRQPAQEHLCAMRGEAHRVHVLLGAGVCFASVALLPRAPIASCLVLVPTVARMPFVGVPVLLHGCGGISVLSALLIILVRLLLKVVLVISVVQQLIHSSVVLVVRVVESLFVRLSVFCRHFCTGVLNKTSAGLAWELDPYRTVFIRKGSERNTSFGLFLVCGLHRVT